MHVRARAGARKRAVVVVTALAVIGTLAPAATAKVVQHEPKPKRVPPPRTGLIVSACKFSHRSNDDPIVYPGFVGASHAHDFFGNVTTDANSTVDSLQGQGSTCAVAGDTAAYWAPVLDVNGVAVRPTQIFAYYSVFGNDPVHTLPIGLKMIAKGAANVRFSCFRHSMPTAAYTHLPPCTPDEMMSIGINFPSCWDGVHLDSEDHMSHMAYPSYGVCPAGYPVKVPRLAIWVMYKAPPRGAQVTLSSGGLDTAHADYVNSWNQQTLSTLEHFCLDGHRECYKEMGRILRELRLPHNKLADMLIPAPPTD